MFLSKGDFIMDLTREAGIIFTNDNCIGCNRCISGCPIPGANIAEYHNGKNRIIVNNDNCIHCGNCINICQHNAREFLDDTNAFFNNLSDGVPISLLIAPSFYANYPNTAYNILGYLKHLGVKKIYNVSVGADIATWAYVNYLSMHPKFKGFSQPCAAVVNYIEKHRPELIKYFMPIHSPLMCLAIYLREYHTVMDELAFISPCIAKEDEITSEETNGLVQYNITFSHLLKKIEGIDISGYYAKPDLEDNGMGSLYPVPGGLKENLEYFLSYDGLILHRTNLKCLAKGPESISDLVDNYDSAILYDLLQCESGCVYGTGTDKHEQVVLNSLKNYNKIRLKYEAVPDRNILYSRAMPRRYRLKSLNEKFKDLDLSMFTRNYTEDYKQEFEISDDVYNQVFNRMYKTTEESRHIDCQSCGYESCKKMAWAIANGYNVLDNCIRYEATQNFKLYTTDKITECPNIYVFKIDVKNTLESHEIALYDYIQFEMKDFSLFNNFFGYSGTDLIQKEFANKANSLLQEDEQLYCFGPNLFAAKLNRNRHKDFIFSLNHLNLPSLEITKNENMQLTLNCGVYQPDGLEQNSDEIEKRLLAAFTLTQSDKNTDIAYYDEQTSQKILNNMMISQQIPSAFKKEEFFVMYQPKVRLTDRQLYGAEALIRWNKNGSIIPPDRFIPVCESTGQVCRLDFFVLNTVCGKMSEWIHRGIEPVKISINFSKLHFSQSDIVDKICRVVDFWEVPHKYIEIEFTETLYTESEQNLHDTVDLLKLKGFSSSIDDFGSGYSSLNLLQKLEFDVLKIDKSLIDTIRNNQKSKLVVSDIIRMAKDLEMDVVAEGVESKETVNILENLNCDLIQGFFFDKPLPAEDFEKRLTNKNHYSK